MNTKVDQTSLEKFTSLAESVEEVVSTVGNKTTIKNIVEQVATNNNLDKTAILPVVSFYLKNRKGVVIKKGKNGGVTFS